MGGLADNIVILQGASQNDLAALFGMNPRDVKIKLAPLKPSGMRGGFPVWSIKEAAPYLAKPPADQVNRILRMHHNDLPKMLAKEFWAGQNARLTYMERTGDLWDTTTVVELAGDAFKTLRLSLILLTDAVEREHGLDEKQRTIITRLVNSALEDMREKLVNVFEVRRRDKSGKSFAPEENGGDEEIQDDI